MKTRPQLLLSVLLAGACASAPPPRPSPGPRPMLARSSIAALLEQRASLGLDEGQVARLQEMDEALEKRKRSICENMRQPREAPDGAGEAASGRRGDDPVMAPSHGLGAGPGRGGGPAPAGPSDPRSVVERATDDADRQAYLQAEELLREGQRERGREIAEKYRERLFDLREARRRDR